MKHNVGNMDKSMEENTKTCLRDKRLLCTTYPQRPGPLPKLKTSCVSRDHNILLKPPMVQSYDAKPETEKRKIKQTALEEMSVSKEAPPSKPSTSATQTSRDKLTVEDADINIKRTSSGSIIVKPPPELNSFIESWFL